ncbi:C-alpha-formylglycine-generating enzyme 1 [Intoshia linei]|uniref:C-alpha-formylglycine-generating enzyme 1 n=1 Tax=Intoshia linei TaxID=1819745 RepID=A0A177AW27_9BILA|nr:C-alpha-formylglycine-generating enzyme 1 [Intoshia linei]
MLKFEVYLLILLFYAVVVNGECSECAKSRNSNKDPDKVVIEEPTFKVKNKPKFSEYEVDFITHLIKHDKDFEMAYFNGGEFHIGTNKPIYKVEAESPLLPVKIDSYWYDKTTLKKRDSVVKCLVDTGATDSLINARIIIVEDSNNLVVSKEKLFKGAFGNIKWLVSNKNFMKFVISSNYTTDSEIFGDSFVVTTFLSEEKISQLTEVVKGTEWWTSLKNATWDHPYGDDTDITNIMNHPVINVSHRDAENYCKWVGKRLPTEAEFEFVCKDGRKDDLFPWGDEETLNDKNIKNIWEGKFPYVNTADDGYNTTCPVNSHIQTKSGIYDIIGNVWEWVDDWWAVRNRNKPFENPKGPKSGKEKVKKGGSFMCTTEYCYRYRCAARSHNTPDTTAVNIGFRCASSKLPMEAIESFINKAKSSKPIVEHDEL